MTYSVIDIEANGLVPSATKIHCLCYITRHEDGSTTEGYCIGKQQMIDWVSTQAIIVGHNIVRYDIPVLKKLLGINISQMLLDTLGFSWYLHPDRLSHNLEDYGIDFGIMKPPVVDWDNLPVEQYVHRCTEDTKINYELFLTQILHFKEIYGDRDITPIMRYLTFKLECARDQEDLKWRLDVPTAIKNYEFFVEEEKKKIAILSKAMPQKIHHRIKSKPKVMLKKNLELSEHGKGWMTLLQERGLPEYHNGAIEIETHREDGNPGSHAQLKDWLFSLGWIPRTFKIVKEFNEEGGQVNRKIPQISSDDDTGVCMSIKDLFSKEPILIQLEDLFVIRHRKGLMKAFLDKVDENGFVTAEIMGFTNTLRFKHAKPCVNLPQMPKKYWKKVREVLIAPDDNHVLCGADMKGLEDNTKHHYMYFFDPEGVKEMRTYAFDSHCDIAVLAKKMSKDEEAFQKWLSAIKEKRDHERILREYYEKEYTTEQRMVNSATGRTLEEILSLSEDDKNRISKVLKPIRLKCKKTNFAAVYGAGAAKIAVTANVPIQEGREFHTTYWTRNKAVKQVADSCIIQIVRNQMWLYNPVSTFWYSLPVIKDSFSCLNQSTGSYCFDTWVKNSRKRGIKNCGQFHDEIITPVLKGKEDETQSILMEAIDETNEQLNLNVKLGISMDWGQRYSDIH